MRRWGTVLTLFYAFIVLILLIPFGIYLGGGSTPMRTVFYRNVMDTYREWRVWIPITIILAGQAILLFLSVDTSNKRLKPKTHIAVTCVVTAPLLSLLTFLVIGSVILASRAKGLDAPWLEFLSPEETTFAFLAILWLAWGLVFYLYCRNSANAVKDAVSWLLKGSALELLVAVPCHVIVRRRGDCCAPAVTGFGIAIGLAVMLLSFGPSVLILYKKRMDSLSTHHKSRTVVT